MLQCFTFVSSIPNIKSVNNPENDLIKKIENLKICYFEIVIY